jgi:hypothetical protein
MFIDETISAGTTTRVRVVLEEGEVVQPDEVGAFALSSLWGGDGDYAEVVALEEGVYEVICS